MIIKVMNSKLSLSIVRLTKGKENGAKTGKHVYHLALCDLLIFDYLFVSLINISSV